MPQLMEVGKNKRCLLHTWGRFISPPEAISRGGCSSQVRHVINESELLVIAGWPRFLKSWGTRSSLKRNPPCQGSSINTWYSRWPKYSNPASMSFLGSPTETPDISMLWLMFPVSQSSWSQGLKNSSIYGMSHYITMIFPWDSIKSHSVG